MDPSTMDPSMALLLALTSLVLWGSWANTLLVAKTRFDLYFLDFLIGHVFAGIAQTAFTGVGAVVAAAHAGLPGIAVLSFSFTAGALWAVATLLIVVATDLAGIAFPAAIELSVEMTLGVPLLLWIEGVGTWKHLTFSLAGVAFTMLAIASDIVCHKWLQTDRAAISMHCIQVIRSSTLRVTSFKIFSMFSADSTQDVQSCPGLQDLETPIKASPANEQSVDGPSQEGNGGGSASSEALSAGLDMEPNAARSSGRGLALAALSGALFSVWPALQSLADGRSPLGNPFGVATLDPASFFLVFTLGALCTGALALTIRARLSGLQFWLAFCALSPKVHALGLIGGLMQGMGSALLLQAGEVLGNTIAVSIARCQPLVCAIWGVFFWKELQGAQCRTRCVFVCTLLLFLCAVTLFLLGGLSHLRILNLFSVARACLGGNTDICAALFA